MTKERIVTDAIREPRALVQPEPGACLSSVVTNILYMNGLVNEKWEVSDTDQLIGRKSGSGVPVENAAFSLLNKGFKLRSESPFDSSRFFKAGIDYLREYYGENWPEPSLSEFWTNETLHERQTQMAQTLAKYALFDEQYSERRVMPSLGSIDQMLDDGQQVIVQVKGSENWVIHSCLAYGYYEEDPTWYKIYWPSKTSGGVSVWPRTEFEKRWRAYEGILGVKFDRKNHTD